MAEVSSAPGSGDAHNPEIITDDDPVRRLQRAVDALRAAGIEPSSELHAALGVEFIPPVPLTEAEQRAKDLRDASARVIAAHVAAKDATDALERLRPKLDKATAHADLVREQITQAEADAKTAADAVPVAEAELNALTEGAA